MDVFSKNDLEEKSGALESMRTELIRIVENELTPVSAKYRYSEEPLDQQIRWKPIVLLLGNYSSGKSTFVNELLGQDVQNIGQAPTDDSFTVLTYSDNVSEPELKDGSVLLGDPQFPFSALKRHGNRFAAHFRLKYVKSDFLKNLAIIDTPGMLDSVSEKDRGYNYQQVVGELAQIADMVLVLFDPHKAGTIRETYESLRSTLPAATYEDRVLFILNRVDECSNIEDLLRVYGTLCWNLSQMTGRKDIPPIYLTYSERFRQNNPDFLNLLKNQRAEIKNLILSAPKYRLDHLVTYIEEHSKNLSHFLEAVLSYSRRIRKVRAKLWSVGVTASTVLGLIFYGVFANTDAGSFLPEDMLPGISVIVGLLAMGAWGFLVKAMVGHAHRRQHSRLDELTTLDWQSRKDSWTKVRPLVEKFLTTTNGDFSKHQIKTDKRRMDWVLKKSSKDMRASLSRHGL
ncbi:MAG: dynamin family protein [Oligoflexales bacterium]